MFSVSVLAGLPFPSRQRVILLLEPFLNEYIYKTQTLCIKLIMFIVNILTILVPTCCSPKAFLSNRGAGLLSQC